MEKIHEIAYFFRLLATTPVDPRVAKLMCDCLTQEGNFGNPASRSHVYGWQAEEAVENARRQVADLINADPREIVWTSGATESNNLAIKGVAHFYHKKGKHIITSKIEHKAVLDTCRQLEREGFEVTYLNPTPDGLISPEQVADALREDTILVSLMHVNNEIGVITDIAAIAEVTRANKVLFHVDAAQSTGKIAIDLATAKVDLMSTKTWTCEYKSAGTAPQSVEPNLWLPPSCNICWYTCFDLWVLVSPPRPPKVLALNSPRF